MQASELKSVPNGLAGFEAVVARAYFPMQFSRTGSEGCFRSRSAAVRIGSAVLTRLYADGGYRGQVRPGRVEDAPFVLNLTETGGCDF